MSMSSISLRATSNRFVSNSKSDFFFFFFFWSFKFFLKENLSIFIIIMVLFYFGRDNCESMSFYFYFFIFSFELQFLGFVVQTSKWLITNDFFFWLSLRLSDYVLIFFSMCWFANEKLFLAFLSLNTSCSKYIIY